MQNIKDERQSPNDNIYRDHDFGTRLNSFKNKIDWKKYTKKQKKKKML